jgi:nucleotide-binding universal stress UspA family protein
VNSRLSSEGIKVQIQSLEANRPAHAIIEYAHKNGMNMIVIATHGYTGMKGMMMGSVALSVIHQSHVPVLLIRPESCRI